MNDKGYDDRPIRDLPDAEMLEQALQSCYDSGYYAGILEYDPSQSEYYEPLLTTAIARRDQCFEELRRRLEAAEALAKLLTEVKAALVHLDADWLRQHPELDCPDPEELLARIEKVHEVSNA